MKYGVEFAECSSIEFDVSPGVPCPVEMRLTWRVYDEMELLERVADLGELDQFDLVAQPALGRIFRRGVPITRDGEEVGAAEVVIELVQADRARVIEGVTRLRDELRALGRGA